MRKIKEQKEDHIYFVQHYALLPQVSHVSLVACYIVLTSKQFTIRNSVLEPERVPCWR